MTTFADVIARTRRRLMTSQREPITVLAANVDADDTELTFTHAIRIVEGAQLSIDLEDVHVTDPQASGTSASVIRGIGGSIGAAHTAGTIVHANPTWTNFQIGQAVNDELADLSSPTNGLFRVRSVEFDFSPATSGYELVGITDFMDVWRVRFDTPGPEADWPVIPRGLWRVDRAADTTEFPSGIQLVLRAGGYPGHKVRVSYKATFDPLAAVTDDVLAVAGLHVEAHDILSLGAAIRLQSGYENQRAYTNTQPDTRYAVDVPPRTAVSSLVPFVEQREERIMAEQARLARAYPEALNV